MEVPQKNDCCENCNCNVSIGSSSRMQDMFISKPNLIFNRFDRSCRRWGQGGNYFYNMRWINYVLTRDIADSFDYSWDPIV